VGEKIAPAICCAELPFTIMRIGVHLHENTQESAVRRVINMRLKGPGIFWHEDTANEMLMLRCYYKAGRWGMLQKMALLPVHGAIA
jgi:hypothetical protein